MLRETSGGELRSEDKFGVTDSVTAGSVGIVGIGCRYPGVAGPSQLWQFLLDGRCAVRDVPADRWDKELIFDTEKPIPRRGAFLDDVRSFDAQFFNIAPREAAQMDPQQRLMLEVAWEALEDAGIDPRGPATRRTGVYVGGSWLDYYTWRLRAGGAPTAHTAVGEALDVIAARVSFALGLQGPSLVVNTGCSGSLVALHLACQALRTGECSAALVGGVNMMLVPDTTQALSRFGGLAPDGISKAFSAAADGFGRGEGIGVVVLRRLADALADGDRIYSVIRATAVNNDGGGLHLSTPSVAAQRQLFRDLYARADIDPARVQYVEAHGTGTPVGDPIEAQALGDVLGRAPDRQRPLRIGSIKTNLGHQEGGSGVAGLIKVALSLHHGRIPPSLHSQPPNPRIDFAGLGLHVQAEPSGWALDEGAPLAGVSSFGWGGTNAHAIVQAALAPEREPERAPERPERVLLLSAASASSLKRRAADLAALLDERPETFDPVCANLAGRRAHLSHRLALVGKGPGSVAEQLRRFAERGELAGDSSVSGGSAGASQVAPVSGRKIVFVFPGQGSQWLAMGQALLAEEPVFAAAARRCGEALREFVDWSLESVLSNPEDAAWLERVDIIQCALWAMQVGLAELWRSWGLEPHAVVGHSMGEVAAACVARAISLRDGARIIASRSRLARRRSGAGGMLHVALSADEAREAVRGRESRVSVAVCSSPRSTVLSGDLAALAEIEQALSERDVFCAPVRVDYASHSPHMDGLLDELRAILDTVAPSATSVAMHSTALARTVDGHELGADYWARNLRDPVRFAEVIQYLAGSGHEVFLEVSPHPVLVPSIEENLQAAGVTGVVAGSLRRDHGGRDQLLARLCDLHVSGAAIRWKGSDLVPDAPVIDLPSYPWEREQHWLAAGGGAGLLTRAGARHAFLRGAVPVALPGRMTAVMARLSVADAPFLQEHRVRDAIVFPAAGHIDLILAAAREVYADKAWSIEDMRLDAALALSADEARAVQVVLEERDPDLVHFTVSSAFEGDEASGWIRHVRGRLVAARDGQQPGQAAGDGTALRPVVVADYYDSLRASGLEYGPCFHGIMSLSVGRGCAEGFVAAPEPLRSQLGMYRVHPALLDAALQLGLAAAPGLEGEPTRVPVRVASARLFRPWPETVRVSARERAPEADTQGAAELEPSSALIDVMVSDLVGAPVMHIGGVALAPLAGRADRAGGAGELMVENVWRPAERRPVEAASVGTWGILDLGGHGDELRRELEGAGQIASLAVHVPGRDPRAGAGGMWQGDFARRETAAAWLEHVERGADSRAAPLSGVVLLGVFDGDSHLEPDWACAESLVLVLAGLSEALSDVDRSPRPRLVLVTTGAQSGGPTRPEWAAVWGAGRVIDAEHPEVPCTRIDTEGGHGSLADVAREILAGTGENEVAYRAGERFVARLERGAWDRGRAIAARRQARISARDTSYRVESLAPGSLDGLAVCAVGDGAIADDLIRVQVDHAGLNFIDLMKAMGIYPGDLDPDRVELGLECSGRITAVGKSVVTDLAVGDEVVATTFHAFRSHVDVRPAEVIRKPVGLSMEQAASYPCAYMTAWYALHQLARVRAGERILIHSGSGGLGLAAIEIARRAGLEIFTTAGSEQKRAYLRGLGIEHVFDSRSLSFVHEIRARTAGRGVDVVLNSLTGEMMEGSLSVLRFGGRFLEVGKRDIYSEASLSMHHFRKAIGYFAIDLLALRAHQPERFRQLLEEVTAEMAAGHLPPLPVECFAVRSVREAFERMARAEHVGKIVLDMKEAGDVAASALPGGSLREEGAYLVSGGLGALGRSAAEWLVRRGARHVVLLGRSGATAEADEAVLRMRAAGARVDIVSCDVGSWTSLSAALLPVLAGRPVRGVVHAAGVLEDATLRNLTAEQVAKVFRPKAWGAWNLHRLTARMPVDFFVLYSSLASLFGSAGQAAYSAANACLDALAHHRLRCGLPATSINWGPVAGVGLAAKSDLRGKRLAARGLEGITVDEVNAALERALEQGWPQVGIARLNMEVWQQSYPDVSRLPRWSALLRFHGAAAPQPQAELRARLDAAAPDRRMPILEDAIRRLTSVVLHLAEDRIARTAPFGSLGLDSLLGLELRNQLERALGQQFPATLLWRYPSIEKLAPALLERADLPGEAAAPAAPARSRGARGVQATASPAGAALAGEGMAADPVPHASSLHRSVADGLAEELVTSTGDQLIAEFEAELVRNSIHLQEDME